MPAAVAGFWSYVQDDDAAEGGRITSLAKQLRTQYRLQTGEELDLFRDRESLEWGDEWKSRIADAIAGTTFFIPVVTPSYFKSQACRNELFRFALEAKKLGLEQLLMPVYWVSVPELDDDAEDSSDEAIRLISRFHWQDLRGVRLEDEDSAAFRKPVSQLATELVNRTRVASSVKDLPDERVSSPARDDGGTPSTTAQPSERGPLAPRGDAFDDEPGLIDKLAAAEDGMTALTDIMGKIGTEIEHVGAAVEMASGDMDRASARGQGMKAQLVLTQQLARSLDAPASEIEQLGHAYATELAKLDPGVHAQLDVAAERDDDDPAEYLAEIQSLAKTADGSLTSLQELVALINQTATLSRSLKDPLRRMDTGLRGVLDGRSIIEEWGRRAKLIEDRTDSNS